MVESILTSSQMIVCVTNDLVDNYMIEHCKLIPHLEFGSPTQAILEVVKIVRYDLESKELSCNLIIS